MLEPDHEADRRARLAALRAEWGKDFDARFGPGSYGLHEVLHTAQVAEGLVSRELLGHPACVRDPVLFAAATQAVEALAEVYRLAGERS